MSALGWLHFLLALLAIALGIAVVIRRKGTRRHRLTGRIYLAAMVALNLAAFFIYNDRPGLGPFHYLAMVSLATLAAGFGVLRVVANTGRARVMHGYFMSWSLAGLLAAGAGQGAAALDMPVGIVIVGLLLIAGGVIHTRDMVTIALGAPPSHDA